jgi:hypothetical protein
MRKTVKQMMAERQRDLAKLLELAERWEHIATCYDGYAREACAKADAEPISSFMRSAYHADERVSSNVASTFRECVRELLVLLEPKDGEHGTDERG